MSLKEAEGSCSLGVGRKGRARVQIIELQDGAT